MSAEDGEHRHPQVERTGAIMKIAGILLIIAGVVALIYGGFSYTSQKKAVDMGAIQIDRTEHHQLTIPPILGVVAIVGGGVLIYAGVKQGR
jgi:drug/metabolite transporter (DMT)-like permease